MRQTLLHTFYDRAVDGLAVLGTPGDAADAAGRGSGSLSEAADRLTRRYELMGGATGFVLGLPSYAATPVTVPVNVGSVAFLQLHLAAAIAELAGHDLREVSVRERCLACLSTDDGEMSAGGETRGWLDRVAGKLGERGIRFLAEQASRLVRRNAGRGARSLPIVGGAVGAVADVRSTRRVARRARRAFVTPELAG